MKEMKVKYTLETLGDQGEALVLESILEVLEASLEVVEGDS